MCDYSSDAIDNGCDADFNGDIDRGWPDRLIRGGAAIDN
jgi:hypothetical protein